MDVLRDDSILIVEDNDIERDFAQAEVTRAGFQRILLARTLPEALEIIDREKPPYVLSDLFFPAGDRADELAEEFLPHYE